MFTNWFDRAVVAYRRRCDREGRMFQQPADALTEVTEHRVVLRNAAGDLARFDIVNGRLRYVNPAPAAA